LGISKIVISKYDPQWPDMFKKERERLFNSVGQWVLDVQHVGSTAIPNLGAKPVIDIMIGVQALQEADIHCLVPITGLGYEYVKEYEKQMPYRRYFRRSRTENNLEYHIHLVEKDSDFWERHLAFRDYLRANTETARQYEDLKRILAPHFSDGNEYALAKTDFIKKVEIKALKWRKEQAN
jgi:GrpB-like predicted nucleotidyltransferase (UPF0157 family)